MVTHGLVLEEVTRLSTKNDGPVAFRPMVTHGLALIVLITVKYQLVTRLTAQCGPVAFRPIVAHGLAWFSFNIRQVTRLSKEWTRGFPSQGYPWFGVMR
jgi:hypothetical protein